MSLTTKVTVDDGGDINSYILEVSKDNVIINGQRIDLDRYDRETYKHLIEDTVPRGTARLIASLYNRTPYQYEDPSVVVTIDQIVDRLSKGRPLDNLHIDLDDRIVSYRGRRLRLPELSDMLPSFEQLIEEL